MLFEEGFEIGLSVGPPELDMDSVALNLQKVQGAAPKNQSDDSIAIVMGELIEAVSGTSQDRLMGVLKGPLNGIRNGPGV